MSINEYRWISRFLESSSLKKTMKQNNEKQWKTMQKTFKNNKTTMKHYEQPALAGPAGPAQALGLSRHRRQRGRRPQRRQPANNVKLRVFHCFHFFIVFYSFFMVFSWFFQRTGFQRTGNPSIFIVGHPSMEIHQWISMDFHQCIHWWSINEYGPLYLVPFSLGPSLGPMVPPLGPDMFPYAPICSSICSHILCFKQMYC